MLGACTDVKGDGYVAQPVIHCPNMSARRSAVYVEATYNDTSKANYDPFACVGARRDDHDGPSSQGALLEPQLQPRLAYRGWEAGRAWRTGCGGRSGCDGHPGRELHESGRPAGSRAEPAQGFGTGHTVPCA